MRFSEHFNDIDIIEEKSGTPVSIKCYGYSDDNYLDFYVESYKDDLKEFNIVMNNPVSIKSSEYDMCDVWFDTKCVGYAIENGYDGVIVEGVSKKYFMKLNVDTETNILTEAPLSGKKIAPAIRKDLKQRRATKTATMSISKPKKAPMSGIRVDVLLANTGKLSPDRVERGMKKVRKQPPRITGVKDVHDVKYFRAEYNFKSQDSKNRQIGYCDVSEDKKYVKELFCSCSDYFYRLYSPYVAAGLSIWNVPVKYKAKQGSNVDNAPHNRKWTVKTNPKGKLFLCKHLWSFLAYYVEGSEGNVEMSDDEIEAIINKHFGDMSDTEEVDTDKKIDSEFSRVFGKLYTKDKDKKIEPKNKEVDEIPNEDEEIDDEDESNDEIV